MTDDGVSGGNRERLERLAERVKITGARAIVVYHMDRFARDLAATLDFIRRFARQGVELHVVCRGRVEADTALGFIVTAVEGLAAEHYRRVIAEKTRDALARLRSKGRCGIGFWGGQCLSLADYVTVMEPADWAPAAGGC